jgi:threonine dehydrogenase-like Zn-dependent dehydrogenase
MDDVVRDHGPFDLIFEASGYSPLAFAAADAIGKNGVLVLSSITGGDRTAQVPTDRTNQRLVLGNQVIVGTVNAAREDFERGAEDLVLAEAIHPGWLERLLTTPVPGLDPEGVVAALASDGAIKAFVELAAPVDVPATPTPPT